jgi:HK97 family phage prohead protease
MGVKTKIATLADFKALDSADGPGSFEALVSVFGNLDAAGEVIAPGAFARQLADRTSFPVVWSHQWTLPPIGLSEVVETDRGLVAKGKLFVAGDDAVDIAKHVWTAMKAGALREWSVGLSVKRERYEEIDGRQVVVLQDLDLIELGPCLKGVNEETQTVSVKALEAVVAEATTETHISQSLPAGNEQERDTAPNLTPEYKRAIAAVLFDGPEGHYQ